MLIAKTALTEFGLSEAQVTKAREAWLDLPQAGTISTRVDIELNQKYFTATCPLTLRQRERLLQVVATAHRPTINHWSKELLLSLMKQKLKPQGTYDSLEKLFDEAVRPKLQTELQEEFVREVNRVTAR